MVVSHPKTRYKIRMLQAFIDTTDWTYNYLDTREKLCPQDS
jgi:hypothetical protein